MHRTKVKVAADALDANQTIARANRDDFDRAEVAVVNFMSAPGAGKTSLLEAALPRPRRRPRGVLEGDVQGSMDADRIAALHVPGRPAQHRVRVRRRVPPRREHGPLGDRRPAAGRPRPAGDRERRQPRLPGRVPGRRGRAGDDLLGHRGRGQAAQVPAHVPRLRAGGGEQDRPAAASRLRPRPLLANVDAVNPEARVIQTSARTGEGVDEWGEWLAGVPRARGGGRLTEREAAVGTATADALAVRVGELLAVRAGGERALLRARGRAARALLPPDGRALRPRRATGRVRALAGRALGRASHRGRVRPPGDRRQAGAAGARARARRAARSAMQAARCWSPTTSRSPSRPRPTPRAAPPLELARERGCLTIAFGAGRRRVGVRPRRRRPVRTPGADRDPLPRALGAGARLLRPSRPARGPRGARRPRQRRLELPLPVPVRGRGRSRRGPRRRPRLGAGQGGRGLGAARADAHRQPRRSWSRPPRACASCSTPAASCSPAATAVRRPTPWTWSRTSARRPRGGRRGGRSTSPRTRRSSRRSPTTSACRRSSSAR